MSDYSDCPEQESQVMMNLCRKLEVSIVRKFSRIIYGQYVRVSISQSFNSTSIFDSGRQECHKLAVMTFLFV